jgi:hypothetical protein
VASEKLQQPFVIHRSRRQTTSLSCSGCVLTVP